MDLAVMMVATAVRIHFGKPVTITSGARCVAHNKAVGGASVSQHPQKRALDIKVSGVAPAAVQAWIIETFPLVSVGKGETFTHIDTRPGNRVVFNY
ncbi:MAG: D-Ala-D-Ala carboxypeptidase family metallohydrolase [Aeromonas sp.]